MNSLEIIYSIEKKKHFIREYIDKIKFLIKNTRIVFEVVPVKEKKKTKKTLILVGFMDMISE